MGYFLSGSIGHNILNCMLLVLSLLLILMAASTTRISKTSVGTVRKYDIVLWGATGFTGSLTAKYLAKQGKEKLRIAIAGRDVNKLEALKASVDLRNLDIIIASLDDPG